MNNLPGKKEKKGSSTAEASIALPLLLILVITIIFCVVRISSARIEDSRYDLTSKIKEYDSMKRKADLVLETLFE